MKKFFRIAGVILHVILCIFGVLTVLLGTLMAFDSEVRNIGIGFIVFGIIVLGCTIMAKQKVNNRRYGKSKWTTTTPSNIPFFASKKKLAEDLLAELEVNQSLVNKTEYFSQFIEYYDEILNILGTMSMFEDKVYVTKNLPSYELVRLNTEFQWHLRDAIERQYDSIIAVFKGEYRNHRPGVISRCTWFRDDLITYADKFDSETTAFSQGLIRQLETTFHINLTEREDDSTNLILSIPIDYELNRIDHMEGLAFEHWCAELLEKNKCEEIEVTQTSNDQGVDVLAEKDGIKNGIQCKCYSSDLGNKPIQEITVGKAIYHCHVGVVMTNRHFTHGAIEAAEATGTLLWDREKLIEMMNKTT